MSCSAARRFEDAFHRSREATKLGGWAARPDHEFAAAVRAQPVKLLAGAGFTEGALERADAFSRLGRQIAVAALAVRTQLEHC